MFPFGHNPYGSSFQSYDPFDQLRLQQELQRRRQAEEYYRRQQLEELNRRRAEQLEYARRQAELQRRREAEARRRRELELEARRRKLSEPSHPRGLRLRGSASPERGAASRRSMFDGGVQDLFDAIYGNRVPAGRRSASSDPRSTRVRFEPEKSEEDMPMEDEDAVSDTEEPPTTSLPPQPTSTTPITPAPDAAVDDAQPEEVDTAPSQAAVSNILSKFATLKSDFKFPDRLDFLNSPEGASVAMPKLAYTPNNAPLHQYEHLLTGLLTQLDAVESYGQESIRKARKDAVRSIEQELGELDARKLQEWRRQFPPAENETPATGSIPEPDSHPELSQDEPITTEASATIDAPIAPDVSHDLEVDPASVPLPVDEEQETHSEATSTRAPDVSSEPIAAPLPLSSSFESAGQPDSNATPTPVEPELASSTMESAPEANRTESDLVEGGYVDTGSSTGLVDASGEQIKTERDGSLTMNGERTLLH